MRGTVLVVEDERMLRSALRRVLAPVHDVSMVERAEEALERVLSGERFDVILTDLMLPGMSGMQLYAELERVAPEQAQAVVFMSGNASSPSAKAFLAKLPGRWVEKPFESQDLLGLLNERLG
ncbi:MAG: response regulator [Myxococcaceae bacterium]|nr:response regulator [Myxococcaceae bacterium]